LVLAAEQTQAAKGVTVQPDGRVLVVGWLRQRSWETPEGERRTKVEIEAEEIRPGLRFVTATLAKPRDQEAADATS
jgi:single-strand DNA-binding protein